MNQPSQLHRYSVPMAMQRSEIEVKRSRFITTIQATDSRDNSRKFIKQMQHEFADANHNCWACVIGAPGSTLEAGMSDDGEPRGAAGKPMLTALLHSDIGDISVVVTRYFGGIRLGKGGMARAYTDAVLNGLSQLKTLEKIDYQSLTITFAYPFLEQIQRLYLDYEIDVIEHHYTDNVTIKLRLPRENTNAFIVQTTELSHGKIEINIDKRSTLDIIG